MFLNPMNDCPDKLIYALCGWLAWCDSPDTYKEALTELKYLLEYRWEEITKSTDGKTHVE